MKALVYHGPGAMEAYDVFADAATTEVATA
jgi:hypothetical protein